MNTTLPQFAPIHLGLDCEHEVHCATCTADPAWRADAERAWGVKIVCPFGKALAGETPEPPPHAAGSPVARPAPQPPETPEVIAERTRESWLDAAKRVAHGAAGLTKYALGIDRSPDELIADRLAICDGCEKSTPKDKPVADRYCDRSGNGAPGCGCWLKAKTALAQEHCPLSKW